MPFVIEPETAQTELEASGELLAVCREKKDFLIENLRRYGALLFRGFGITSEADLERFSAEFSGKKILNYTGGASPRSRLEGKVYTSTEYPPDLTLALHNELSYAEEYPRLLFFCCVIVPETGGETSIADSRRILNRIESEIVRVFRQKGVMYIRNLDASKGSGYSWQDAFETEDKLEVEAHCRAMGADFEWKPNDVLRLSQTRPATVVHPETGEEVWFNQAHGFHPSALDERTYQAFISVMPEEDFRLNAKFGDGSEIPKEMLEQVRAVLASETVLFPWRAGDVLVLDNLLAAHGRMPFTGARKIILAMA
ncbi:MAG: TauD/TfdA family dioxygenase [Acidobacteriota bacterium]|nr:TauD/TfdA family dioxygenase [Acidobacteriota bacterium]